MYIMAKWQIFNLVRQVNQKKQKREMNIAAGSSFSGERQFMSFLVEFWN